MTALDTATEEKKRKLRGPDRAGSRATEIYRENRSPLSNRLGPQNFVTTALLGLIGPIMITGLA
jgi:hypothetical protein